MGFDESLHPLLFFFIRPNNNLLLVD